jgi:hypothetical protein
MGLVDYASDMDIYYAEMRKIGNEFCRGKYVRVVITVYKSIFITHEGISK